MSVVACLSNLLSRLGLKFMAPTSAEFGHKSDALTVVDCFYSLFVRVTRSFSIFL